MKRIHELNPEDAKILLQSQALSSALWLASVENSEQVAIRLPDPAYVDSKNWPSYLKKEEDTTIKTNDSIDFIKKIETPVLPEIKAIEQDYSLEINTQEVQIVPQLDSKPIIEVPQVEAKLPIVKSKPSPKKEPATLSSISPVEPPIIDQDMHDEHQTTVHSKRIPKNLDFYQWLEELHSGPKNLKKQKLQPEAKLPIKTKSEPISDTRKAIETSLTLKEEVISETLAKLLARQGHKLEAINMYEKLMLKFPEKGPTFATAIEKLKT